MERERFWEDDIDNLMDDLEEKSQESSFLVKEDSRLGIDTNGTIIELVEKDKPTMIRTVKTDKLRFDFNSIEVDEIRSLHRVIIERDPLLYIGERSYTLEQLGSGYDEIEKHTDKFKGESLTEIVGSEGSLGKYLQRREYKNNRYNLLQLLNTHGDNNLDSKYTKGRAKENEKLKVLQRQVFEDRMVKPNDSKAFLDKHRKKSVMEKVVLKNLGLRIDDLNRLVGTKSVLTEDEKARLLTIGSGIWNPIKHKHRYKPKGMSFGDLDMLMFLDVVKLASERNLYYANGAKEYGKIHYRLRRLESMGIVKCMIVYNSPGVWALTSLGKHLIDSSRVTGGREQAGLASLSERIYVNHVIACLWSGVYDFLGEGEVKYNRVNAYGERVQGETLVPERDIWTSFSLEKKEQLGGYFVKENYKGEGNNILKEQWELNWRKWELSGGEAPEESRPWHYLLFYDGVSASSYICPDIIVKRPRGEDKKPQSIAIEVERQERSVDEYVKRLRIYQKDTRVYSKVIYVTNSKRIAKNIKEAARIIGFTRFDIVPMRCEKGLVKEGISQWHI